MLNNAQLATHYRNLAAAWRINTSKYSRALAAEYDRMADELTQNALVSPAAIATESGLMPINVTLLDDTTPTITSLSPNIGAAGDTITVTGTNFTGSPITVNCGGTIVTPTVASSTSLTFVVPNLGQSSVTTNVIVIAPAGPTPTSSFNYTIPITGDYPDATTTGPRTALTTYNGTYTTTSNNQVISGLDINGRFVNNHTGTILRDCRIRGDQSGGGGRGFYGIQNISGKNFALIEYCEIGRNAGSGESLDVGAQIGSTEIRFCDIHNTSDGIQASGGANIHDNYIHDLYHSTSTAHIDAIQMFTGSGTTRIENNWVDCRDYHPSPILSNGSVFFQGTFNPVVISNNYLTGTGFILRLESGVSGAIVTGNRFRLYGTQWGTHSIQGQVTTWNTNINDITGATISL